MRVILGLAALAASVSAQTTVTPSTNNGNFATPPVAGNAQTTALASILLTQTSQVGQPISTVTPTGFINSGQLVQTNTFAFSVPNAISTVVWTFTTNAYTGQIQYRWAPNYGANFATQYNNNQLSSSTYTCDPCSGGTPVSCNVNGPGTTGLASGTNTSSRSGYACASLVRTYTMTNLATGASSNSFAVQLLDLPSGVVLPDTSSYSFIISRSSPAIIGDPQIVGMQGQDFQVHGMPDEIFNMITYPNLQVNARFVYLSSGACHDNFTACFAHPGTYISEEGIRLGSDKIHVSAGSFKKGLTVSVNGKKVTEKKTSVKLGSVEVVNHRRVVVTTPIMAITISNSDKFLNQETALFDQKLLTLGSERRGLLVGESFHPEVPLHGLQGQTWRNVEYPSGLDYEGSISDYHVTDGNLFGTKFVFNQFKH